MLSGGRAVQAEDTVSAKALWQDVADTWEEPQGGWSE